jgi:hypothetical protein
VANSGPNPASQAEQEALRAEVLDIIEYCEAGDDAGDHSFTPDAAYILLVIEEREANRPIYTVAPTLADVVAVLRGVSRA